MKKIALCPALAPFAAVSDCGGGHHYAGGPVPCEDYYAQVHDGCWRDDDQF